MAMARFHGQVTDVAGNIVSAPSVLVQSEAAGLPVVPIFADRDGVNPLGNPFTGDADGSFSFCVVGGLYRITVSKDTFSKTLIEIGIGTSSETDSV